MKIRMKLLFTFLVITLFFAGVVQFTLTSGRRVTRLAIQSRYAAFALADWHRLSLDTNKLLIVSNAPTYFEKRGIHLTQVTPTGGGSLQRCGGTGREWWLRPAA